MNDTQLPADDHRLAATLAEQAGQLLLAIRREGLSGHALGDAGDARANALILEAIARARPEDAILSEESADSAARLGRSRVWIIDPLDGTREYREGREDWAVHVALAVDGVAAIGAVALPGLGVTLATDDVRLAPAAPSPRMVVSRTRPPPEALHVAQVLGCALVPMGSAGAKAMAVVRGQAEIYLHAGGQHEWDSCAPVAVARAAGLHCSRLDGSPLRYNRADPSLPDLLICRPELAGPALEALRAKA